MSGYEGAVKCVSVGGKLVTVEGNGRWMAGLLGGEVGLHSQGRVKPRMGRMAGRGGVPVGGKLVSVEGTPAEFWGLYGRNFFR